MLYALMSERRPIPSICLSLFAALLFTACASTGPTGLGTSGIEQDLRIASNGDAARTTQSDLLYTLLVGELAGKLGNLEDAVNYYRQAAQLSPDPQIAARATRIGIFAKDLEGAAESAQRWVELEPKNIEAQQILGILLVRQQRFDDAMLPFEKVLQATAESKQNGFLLIGGMLSREQDSELALKAMQLLVSRHDDSAEAHFAHANLAGQSRQYELAVAESDRALQLKPDWVEVRSVRARALAGLGKTDEALNDMASVVESQPEHFELRLGYARMLLQAKRFAEARAQFMVLLKQKPEDADLLYTFGLVNLQEKQYDDAAKAFNRMVKTGNRVDEGYYYLGRVNQERKDYAKAVSWYNRVGESEFYVDAHARIASMYHEQGDTEKARAHFRDQRNRAGDANLDVQFYLAEGQFLREIRQYQDAMTMYSDALNQFPGNTDLLYGRALMAEKIDRLDLLEADLRTILKDEPDNVTALNALGYTLADRSDRLEEARGYIERAFEVRPDDPAVVDSMGWLHFKMGNYDKAEEYIRQAFSMLDDGEVAGHLSEILWAKGQHDEARNVLRDALKKEPDNDYLQELTQRFGQ